MSSTLNWGIIGAGGIAKAFADGLKTSPTGKLVAVGSRSKDKAVKWGTEYGLAADQCHGSYEALLADPAVHAVYVATPHPMHAEWAIKACEAKKHVLVEKPVGLNAHEAMAIVEAAVTNDVFLMEAFMYRCTPQTAAVVELVKQKAIGDLQVIVAPFSFRVGDNPESRLLKNDLGGGGILDVGCYATSMARLLAGAAVGKDFDEPIDVKGVAHLHPTTRVDQWASAVLKFSSGILAECSTGVRLNRDNALRLYGTEGSIIVWDPWVPARNGGSTKITIKRSGKPDEERVIESPQHIYGIEADTVARYLEQKQAASPAMSWQDTLGNMRTLDAWRQSAGIVYDRETPAGFPSTTFAGRKLARKPDAPIPQVVLPGLDAPVSRLVMGVDNQRTMPHAAAMFDLFFELGGTTFDTAYIYGTEKTLGNWIRNRGVDKQVNVIVKGAHTPDCNPEDLSRQLKTSLERLERPSADFYFMHRDNEDVPVGEFIDVLNEHVKAGRIKVFGGSNWAIDRVKKANAYAKRKGLQGFGALSNNLSLAEMIKPVWDGCLHVHDAQSRKFLKKTQLPLFPWSSQARGFFVPGVASPQKTDNRELTNSWYSPDNFQRQARAFELAKKKGVHPINIALAYVLCQPFPTFPLIGPRQPSELRTSLPALGIQLTPKEMKWLNLEA